jgi:hypothetical protein
MSRSFAVRLARIEARVSWRHSTWHKQSGAEWSVPSALIFDAWFRSLLGQPIDLDPAVSHFIATSIPPRPNQGDMEVGVYDACRAIWFPQEAQQEEA